MKTQNWRLLRYLDSILLSLYEKDSSARYTQYNLSWPLLNRLRWDGAKIKAIATTLSKKLHISNSTFATFFFPFILTLKENERGIAQGQAAVLYIGTQCIGGGTVISKCLSQN